LVVWPLVIAAGQRADGLLHDEVGGVLVLPRALAGCGIAALEFVHTLAAEHGMMVCGGECVRQVRLIPLAVAAILRLAVDDVADDAIGYRFLLSDERNVVPARFSVLFC